MAFCRGRTKNEARPIMHTGRELSTGASGRRCDFPRWRYPESSTREGSTSRQTQGGALKPKIKTITISAPSTKAHDTVSVDSAR